MAVGINGVVAEEKERLVSKRREISITYSSPFLRIYLEKVAIVLRGREQIYRESAQEFVKAGIYLVTFRFHLRTTDFIN